MFRDRKPCRSRMHAVRNCMSVRYLLRKICVRTTCLPAPKVRFKVFLYCNAFVRRRVLSTRSEASMENDIVLILSIQTCRDPRKESYSRKKYCFFFFLTINLIRPIVDKCSLQISYKLLKKYNRVNEYINIFT